MSHKNFRVWYAVHGNDEILISRSRFSSKDHAANIKKNRRIKGRPREPGTPNGFFTRSILMLYYCLWGLDLEWGSLLLSFLTMVQPFVFV